MSAVSPKVWRIGIDARKLTDFGIGTYIRNLIVHLAAIDTENEYVLFGRAADAPLRPPLADNFRWIDDNSPDYSLRELVAFPWKIAAARLDLFHATHYVLPLGVRAKTVITIHDIIHLLYPQFLRSRLAYHYANRMIGRALRSGTRVITVSHNTREDLLRHFDVAPEKIEVVYNGVSALFRPEHEPQAIEDVLRRYQLKPPYLLFVGNNKPHKNLHNVIKAFYKAKREAAGGLEHKLVFAGKRPDNDFRLHSRIRNLDLEKDIVFLGYVDEMALAILYQQAEVFLYPTLYEGFGLPVIEAMRSGVPVLTSNTSALKEIASGYAFLVNPLDVDEIARAILELTQNSGLRAELRVRGLRRAEDFSWERTAARTLKIYRAVLEGAPGQEEPHGTATNIATKYSSS